MYPQLFETIKRGKRGKTIRTFYLSAVLGAAAASPVEEDKLQKELGG